MNDATPPVGDWGLDRLVDHIVTRHHQYVRSALPAVTDLLAGIVAVDGERHPELVRVAAIFGDIRQELEHHMLKEERILFPYVGQLWATRGSQGRARRASPFGTVQNPIRMLEREHQAVADKLREIRALTKGYSIPTDGCTAYATCMRELERFETDLDEHVHLEDHILFPKAIDLEELPADV